MARFVLDPKAPPSMNAQALAHLDAMTEAEVEAAALSDADNPPMTDVDADRLASARRIQDVRRRTGLSQARFAAAFRINVGRLRDLERGRTRPDSALLAYLTVIDKAPEVVRKALADGGGDKSNAG